MKRIVSIQDLSCLGKCSLTVALPIISAMGVECAVVPTAVLSTHTMFQGYTCRDLTDQIDPIGAHWRREGLDFDAICTGYLASAPQIDRVLDFFDRFRTKDNFILADPAMADYGRLYPAFDDSFPAQMARVCARADVVLPNMTEASLLTGLPYRETYDEAFVREVLEALTAMGPRYAALTGVSYAPDQVGVASLDQVTGRFSQYFHRREPTSYHGTGDVFSAVCAGGLMNGLTLEASLALAADYTAETIRRTAADEEADRYGVEFEKTLPLLISRLDEAKKQTKV